MLSLTCQGILANYKENLQVFWIFLLSKICEEHLKNCPGGFSHQVFYTFYRFQMGNEEEYYKKNVKHVNRSWHQRLYIQFVRLYSKNLFDKRCLRQSIKAHKKWKYLKYFCLSLTNSFFINKIQVTTANHFVCSVCLSLLVWDEMISSRKKKENTKIIFTAAL